MGLFTQRVPPQLPAVTPNYSPAHTSAFYNMLRIYFNGINAVQVINVAGINIDLDTLPTEADVATLRDGDVFTESRDGSLRVATTPATVSTGTIARSDRVLLWLSM